MTTGGSRLQCWQAMAASLTFQQAEADLLSGRAKRSNVVGSFPTLRVVLSFKGGLKLAA